MTSRFATGLAAFAALSLSTPADARKPRPVEPIPVPADIEQGVGMIFVEPDLKPTQAVQIMGPRGTTPEEAAREPLDEFVPMSPIYTQLRKGLAKYHARWGKLPATFVEVGAPLSKGSTGARVSALRQRLGLSPGNNFDLALDKVVREFQQVHGLEVDGIVAGRTLLGLNTPVRDWELRIVANIERAKRLPPMERFQRFVIVDAAAAKLYMVENGAIRDSMKVIVGAPTSPTPMMAAKIETLSLNPYWNVPLDLGQTLIAPKVLSEGPEYLTERHYTVFSDWTEDAVQLDPARVDWRAVASGRLQVRLRRDPSPGNSMGTVKFNLPNDWGIYLHDTYDKAKFKPDMRQISNGCVRLEDAPRFARWLTRGAVPKTSQPEKSVPLAEPVPIYMTYLTAVGTDKGVTFRMDPYRRDAGVLITYYHKRVPIGAW